MSKSRYFSLHRGPNSTAESFLEALCAAIDEPGRKTNRVQPGFPLAQTLTPLGHTKHLAFCRRDGFLSLFFQSTDAV